MGSSAGCWVGCSCCWSVDCTCHLLQEYPQRLGVGVEVEGVVRIA